MRKEHDKVFGQGFETTMKILKDEPHRLNQLPLTLAASKRFSDSSLLGLSSRREHPGTHHTVDALNCLLTAVLV
jgi:hypothetical protein